ncbi:MAG: hypothetical protein KBD66_03870 [Candidatus Doudnabacteria bacterium]|nr:hypothetical protein [Candidatus Doudnabacteria bacterium]
MKPELILVYNANATVFAVTVDFFHKLFSPQTYQCNLCRVTYGPVTIKKEWKEFLNDLSYTVTFYHKDQFAQAIPGSGIETFPIILTREAGVLSVLVTTEEINQISTVEELKLLLIQKLQGGSVNREVLQKQLEDMKDTMTPAAYETAKERLDSASETGTREN